MDYQLVLKNLKPKHNFFIGIDSDGCVFDTMERKQKDFFIPTAIEIFDLYPISEVVKETWEFVNLYSIHRGGNRFTSIIKVFDLLAERTETNDFILPDMRPLKKWVSIETKLGNDSLRSYCKAHNSPYLEKVLKWSEKVNDEIADNLHPIPPFENARKSILKMSEFADLVIVSQTPLKALEREWEQSGLTKYIRAIAGQEHGSKTEHLSLAAKGKYPGNKILMIGDAKGDLTAAKNNDVLFFPVIAGMEEKSWEKFHTEGLKKLITGNYSTAYEMDLLSLFNKSLPESPAW